MEPWGKLDREKLIKNLRSMLENPKFQKKQRLNEHHDCLGWSQFQQITEDGMRQVRNSSLACEPVQWRSEEMKRSFLVVLDAPK